MECRSWLRRAAPGAVVGALLCSSATAASYPVPDYSVNANVTPFTTSGPITISFSTSNLSDVAAPATIVEFSVAPAGNPATRSVLGQAPAPALNRWSSASQTVSFPIPAWVPVGNTPMRLTATINPQHGNGETRTDNNSVTTSFATQLASALRLPDLTVTNLNAPGSATAGAALAITGAVRNMGAGDAGRFTVSYYLESAAGRTNLAEHSVDALPANGNSLESFSVTLPAALSSGAYTLKAHANATGSIAEVNTGNNIASLSVSISAGPSSGGSSGSSGGSSGSGSSGVWTYVSSRDALSVPSFARPALRAPFTDPTFKTTITRLTDPSMSPSDGSNRTIGLRHEYARYAAINADNTKVIVRVLGGMDRGYFEVRDLASGALLYKIGANRGDPEMSWHPTSPNLLFYRTSNEVRIFHVDTGQSEVVMSFPQYYAISSKGEGRPSDDWRYYAFVAFRDSSYTTADIVVADLTAKRIVKTWSNSGRPDWVSMSPSGKYVVAQWTDSRGTLLYDRDSLSLLRTAFSDAAHCDFAYDAQGDEVIVYRPGTSAAIVEAGSPSGHPIVQVRLSDGKRTKLLDLGWKWFSNHMSGIASRKQRGWVLVSTYTSPDNAQQPFSREIFWLKLDGSGEVRRIAHHHSDQGFVDGKKDYWAEPQATSSWDGSIVLFSSVWNQPFSEYDLYSVTGKWW